MSPSPSADPCVPREVVAGDGASVRFCAHGGHVLGWAPAGGPDRLWLSRDTGCGPGTAIRGGIPVVWPQFAERGDGPRHGVARDRAWVVLDAGPDEDGTAHVHLRLTSDAGTHALVPHAFTLDLVVRAAGARLTTTLSARNDGTTSFTATAALHTYLRVGSTASAHVVGLAGLDAHDNATGASSVLPREPLPVTGPVDLAVGPVPDGAVVRLVDPVLGDVELRADGFGHRVVWNPGADGVPGDVHPGGEQEFACVEPALLDPVDLAPGQSWSGTQRLDVVPRDG